jgi:predicted nucleic acid-binding protein
MTVRTFVDSNIPICAHAADAGLRQRRASEQLVELWVSGGGLLSTQVLQEFYVNVTRKIKAPLTPSAAVATASEIGEIWQLSYWDGMILAAAEQSRADRLLTEDPSHGARIAGIEIVVPFR